MRQYCSHGVREVADVATAIAGGLAMLGSASLDGPVETVWWAPRRAALVLGRGSVVSERPATTAELDVVRRSSGGGPVLWDSALLALDIVVPRGHQRFMDDVTRSYEWIGRALAAAIGGLGPDARALTVDEARRTNDAEAARLACFAGRSPWEIVIDDRKLVGLSQTRRRHGAIVQVGVLGNADSQQLPDSLDLTADAARGLSTTLDQTTIGLAELGLDPETVRAAIDSALASAATDR